MHQPDERTRREEANRDVPARVFRRMLPLAPRSPRPLQENSIYRAISRDSLFVPTEQDQYVWLLQSRRSLRLLECAERGLVFAAWSGGALSWQSVSRGTLNITSTTCTTNLRLPAPRQLRRNIREDASCLASCRRDALPELPVQPVRRTRTGHFDAAHHSGGPDLVELHHVAGAVKVPNSPLFDLDTDLAETVLQHRHCISFLDQDTQCLLGPRRSLPMRW